MNKYLGRNHTYVICAYQESIYLDACIRSLQKQTVPSNIIMVTSTPGKYLSDMAKRYQIPLLLNEGEKGIAGDWNFALSRVRTPIATIAHQDDIYEPWYTETLLSYINQSKRPLIFFSDYGEIRDGQKKDHNRLLDTKRLMLMPLRPKWAQRSIFIRRRVLSMGSPISCPTVSYFLPNLPDKIFSAGYRSSLDWQAWEKLSRLKGDFIFCSKICMYHRIHAESTTTEVLQENGRYREDLEMFSKFWPRGIARILERFYKDSEKSNEMRN